MVVDAAPAPEKREAYDRVEKLRDPSHTSALTPAEFLRMAGELNLREVRSRSYRMEMELEEQLRASSPLPGDAGQIRDLFRRDLGRDNPGMGAYLQGGEIHFAYPILILVGKKGFS